MTAAPCPTSAALLAAVIAAPDDDLPRLALADHLDESGDDADKLRAEFIHVQCEIAANRFLSGATGSDAPVLTSTEMIRGGKLRRREAELWRYAAAWFPSGAEWSLLTAEVAGLVRPHTIVRRGFVDEVRCSLATLFGGPCGPCERCAGTGAVERLDSAVMRRFGLQQWDGCPMCGTADHTQRGTGHTPGIAAALWRSQPVQAVVCVGAEPALLAPEVWSWRADRLGGRLGRDDDREIIPWEIIKLMRGGGHYGPNYHRRDYPTRQLALAALSAACVAAGRARAACPG